MKVLIIAGSIVPPLFMFYSEKKWLRLRFFYNIVAILAILVFGNIASLSIYSIIKNNEVFMTAIHGVFLDPYFLISGAYIGIYTIYRIMLLSMKE